MGWIPCGIAPGEGSQKNFHLAVHLVISPIRTETLIRKGRQMRPKSSKRRYVIEITDSFEVSTEGRIQKHV